MLRALALAALCAVLPSVADGQPLSVLHITIRLLDAERHLMPVPRHALLISDDPPTTVPRRTVTALDGTTSVSLRPGSYIVESDKPIAFEGKSYEWTQMVTIVAGQDAALDLTAANAEIGAVTAEAAPLAQPLQTEPSLLLQPWQDSVVALWTPTARASGFVIDPKGLVATTQRAVGTATSVEVQLSSTVKVAGRVLAADAARDVAVVWVDPGALGSVKPVPYSCGGPARPPLVEGQTLFTIGVPLREPKSLTSGEIKRLDSHAVVSDFTLAEGSAGGPVFSADGVLVGLTSIVDEPDDRRGEAFRVIRTEDACDVVASAAQRMSEGPAPPSTHLPIEPARSFPEDALKTAIQRGGISRTEYMAASSDFDIAFITPVLMYGAQQMEQNGGRAARAGTNVLNAPAASDRALMEFSNWSTYVADTPPVLMIRVTPRLVEGFWMKVARGAAMTQGAYVPSLKHFKSGFSRMRAFCGSTVVTPIHPFVLEHRISDTETIDEGLYVFDPGALGPQCGGIKLELYSEKDPEKGDTRAIDPKVIQHVWDDFAPYRALN